MFLFLYAFKGGLAKSAADYTSVILTFEQLAAVNLTRSFFFPSILKSNVSNVF